MSNAAIFTSFEGDYQLGVAALLNSAIHAGFEGEFHVFHRGALPRWAQPAPGLPATVANVSLHFHEAQTARHFGYDKPYQATDLLKRFDYLDTLYYFDPDIVILAPWVFFSKWPTFGIGLIMDGNAPVVPANHPWRCEWRQLTAFGASGASLRDREPFYANSGFFCLHRKDQAFLHRWKEITDRFESSGGDTRGFHLDERWRAVTGDQDLLAATIEGWEGRLSLVGPDGMGFNGHYWLLSHATEQPKPWRINCIIEALKGHPPGRTVGFYLNHANGAVHSRSPFAMQFSKFNYRLARALGCLWSRP